MWQETHVLLTIQSENLLFQMVTRRPVTGYLWRTGGDATIMYLMQTVQWLAKLGFKMMICDNPLSYTVIYILNLYGNVSVMNGQYTEHYFIYVTAKKSNCDFFVYIWAFSLQLLLVVTNVVVLLFMKLSAPLVIPNTALLSLQQLSNF